MAYITTIANTSAVGLGKEAAKRTLALPLPLPLTLALARGLHLPLPSP